MATESELFRAASSIGAHLVPRGEVKGQAYWNKNWSLIQQLPQIEAILGRDIYFFSRTQSRHDAWALLQSVNISWDTVRWLSGKSGPDRKWLDEYLPKDHRLLFPAGTSLSFYDIETLAENIFWAYGLNSRLRHPGANAASLDEMFRDPWADSEACRLIEAANGVRLVLKCFKCCLDAGEGFDGDIDEKRMLANNAAQSGLLSEPKG